MCDEWVINYKADLYNDKYAVTGYVLANKHYYGEYGMAEFPTTIYRDEYKLDIDFWYTIGNEKRAGTQSDIRFTKHFDSREEVNEMWLMLKKNVYTPVELVSLGFKRNV